MDAAKQQKLKALEEERRRQKNAKMGTLIKYSGTHTTPAGMVMLSDPQSTANSNILKSVASRESIDEESAPIGITEIKSPALPVGRSLVRPPHR
jgi:hypothetical protein